MNYICPPPPPSRLFEVKTARLVALALFTGVVCFASPVAAQTFPDPQPRGTTITSGISGDAPTHTECGVDLMHGTHFTEPPAAVLTVVQGADVAARTFRLGDVSRAETNVGVYLIDYQVDPIGEDVQTGQAAARDYMGLTLTTDPLSARGDTRMGIITAALGSVSSNAFANGFGRADRQLNTTLLTDVSYRLELVLTPGAGILTEGSASRIQVAYDVLGSSINPCATAGQVFELRVIPALSDAAFAAFTDDADPPLSLMPFVTTSPPTLAFKFALPSNLYETTYEASAEVVAGTNTGTILTVTLPDTPDGAAEVMLSGVAAGDVIAIDAAAAVQAQATHERLAGRFLVSVVATTNGLDNPTRDLGAVRVGASHEVLPGIYALAEGKTDSARVTTPSDVIAGQQATPPGHIAETGVFSFTVMGLSEAASRTDVVIALASTLTATAMPYKYDMDAQVWNEFDPNDGNDAYYGAVMVNDACPETTDNAAWTRGVLATGDGCLRVTLTDGGPNDADGARNGVIHDPIALVGLGGGSGGGGGGGGVMGWGWLLAILLAISSSLSLRRFRQSR